VNLQKIYFTTDERNTYEHNMLLLLLLLHNCMHLYYILFIQRDTRIEQFQE